MIMNGLSQGGGSDSRVPVIYTTSYVGTGTSGQNNPNTLTFDFVPEFIWICAIDHSSKTQASDRDLESLLRCKITSSSNEGNTNFPFCMCANLTTNYENYKGFMYADAPNYTFVKKSEDGKTISWYYNSNYGSMEQFNKSDNYRNYIYRVLAIGYKEES